MKVNTTNRTFVLVEPIDQSTHTIIPELDHTTVQTGEDPWSLRVEGEALHSVTLRLKFRQHNFPTRNLFVIRRTVVNKDLGDDHQ